LLEYAARYRDAAGLLFDAPPASGLPGGTGRTFDWDALPKKLPQPLVLSGGLTAANVAEAIRRLRPWAVDVSSGVEVVGADGATVKGIKDPARIAAFIGEVRHADVRST
jgi:phosphoribosylanthranilate isomerase